MSDANWKNNLGQENTQVLAAHSPASSYLRLSATIQTNARYTTFEWMLFRSATSRHARLAATGHVSERITLTARLAALSGQPESPSTPLPAGWSVGFDPATPIWRFPGG